MKTVTTFVAALLLCAGCGGAADVGDPCDTSGSTDECTEDAVCTDEESGNYCRVICEEDTDCPADQHCDSIAGTELDSCQPR